MKRIIEPLKPYLSNGDMCTEPSWEKCVLASDEDIEASREEEKHMHKVTDKKSFYKNNEYLHIVPWETFMNMDMSRFLTDGNDGYMIFETDETDPVRARGASIFLKLSRL